MRQTDDIREAFRSGETGYLDAILSLEARGLNAKDAEALVLEWEREPQKSWKDTLGATHD